MGNTISTNHETKSILDGNVNTNSVPGAHPPGPIFYKDVKAEKAKWSDEGVCVAVQRLFGWVPDSETEALKQNQQFPFFYPPSSKTMMFTVQRREAASRIEDVYRHYTLLRKWHEIANQILVLARKRIEVRSGLEEEDRLVNNFHQILVAGLSASKVSITGKLKNIVLQLIMRPEKEEFYLTWKPSRKRYPRLYLQDIEDVVPVLESGNMIASRLASKVSHRRGIIIVCKSHHRGRVILELNSKRERNLLLHGFGRLLEEMNLTGPLLDESGAMRKRRPRLNSVSEFFDFEKRQLRNKESLNEYGEQTTAHANNSKDCVQTLQPELSQPNLLDDVITSSATMNSKKSDSIEHFYQTRFDDTMPKANDVMDAARVDNIDKDTEDRMMTANLEENADFVKETKRDPMGEPADSTVLCAENTPKVSPRK